MAVQPGPPGWLNIVIQLGAMMFMYRSFAGKNKAVGEVVPAAIATPTPFPTATPQPEIPSWLPAEFRDTMKVAAESQSGKRVVPPALSYWEDDRVSRVNGAIASSATRLVSLWRPGMPFEAYVYLSERAEPLTSWAMEPEALDWDGRVGGSVRGSEDVESEYSLEEEGNGEVNAASNSSQKGMETARTVSKQWNLMGDAMAGWTARTSQSIGATNPPARRLRNATFTGLIRVAHQREESAHAPPLFWCMKGLLYDTEPGNDVEQRVRVHLPMSVRTNASSLFAHIFLVQAGFPLDPAVRGYDRARIMPWVNPMIRLLEKKPEKVTFNLMSGDDGKGTSKDKPKAQFGIGLQTEAEGRAAKEEEDKKNKADIASGALPRLPYWKPTLGMEAVIDTSVYNPKQLPPNIKAAMQVLPLPAVVGGMGGMGGDLGGMMPLPTTMPLPVAPDAATLGYLPLFHINDFWTLGHHLTPLNETVESVDLMVSFRPAPMWRWAIQSQMTSTWEVQSSMGSSGSGDTDMLKGILMDTNPVLLTITMLVSILHMVFDFLAFRNDISFWRSAKSLEGLSIRTLTLNLVQQIIIAAYLFNENTSWMILFSQVIGLVIEVWKLRKAVAVTLTWRGWIPIIDFSDKEESYAASRTKEYDDIATAHLLFVLCPLVAGYAAYSLFYDRHRSWLSWLLSSLTGFVYTFGFAQMVPQLYINYRMKSVAHMPWRAMVYKALNTFIDDLFAFVVKMPTLHRLSVFRDDIIFFCYLYQRYAYPIDKSRKNEYGASALDYEAMEARKKGEVRQPRRGKMDRRQEGPLKAALEIDE